MDVDAVELHPLTDVVMPVSPEPVKTVTVKAPSEPLPAGMRFVKKPKIIDVRVGGGRKDERGDRKSGAGGVATASGATGGEKKVDKRRHSP